MGEEREANGNIDPVVNRYQRYADLEGPPPDAAALLTVAAEVREMGQNVVAAMENIKPQYANLCIVCQQHLGSVDLVCSRDLCIDEATEICAGELLCDMHYGDATP